MPGEKPADLLASEADAVFSAPLEGKSVLDIGAWDGFFSFEAERRGAARVLSTDHFCWSGDGWGTKAGYDLAHKAFGSKAESKDVDVFDLDPGVDGKFDVVLFLGVFYHLKNPYGGLEKAAAMADDLLIVETVTTMNRLSKPVMRHFEGGELDGDPTNYFTPNTLCLESMLREIGFRRIEIRQTPELRPAEEPGLLIKSARTLRRHFPQLEREDRDRHIAFAWR